MKSDERTLGSVTEEIYCDIVAAATSHGPQEVSADVGVLARALIASALLNREPGMMQTNLMAQASRTPRPGIAVPNIRPR